LFACVVGLSAITGCKPDDPLTRDREPTPYVLSVPGYFPPINTPNDNQLTDARVALGKRLFYDPLLSIDSTISCGSCHQPSLAFTDGRTLPFGVQNRVVPRNAPSLANLGFYPAFNWDGGVPTIELQAFVPIQNHVEMDMPFDTLVARLRRHPQYPQLFREAYNREPDNYSIVRALAAFQRTLVSASSPYDRYIQGDSSALTPAQKRGMALFFGERAECFHCHGGALFTDNTFQNNGLYLNYTDEGRGRVTGRSYDVGKFKVPTLRNIALTAPYMHDGSLQTLEQVVQHYSTGGQPHPNRSALLRPFTLTTQERQDLVDFLHALTDSAFINNPAHAPTP
jgi:cytochrome c peroxidase